ncbi:MAG: hypothetical protein WC584_01700 [Candidatus Pacearchaeota archaeon]
MASSTRNQLIEYFKKNISKGYSSETLKWALIKQGYSRVEIDRANEEAHKELSKTAPVLKEKPKIKYELLDEENKPIKVYTKKPWWKKLLGF